LSLDFIPTDIHPENVIKICLQLFDIPHQFIQENCIFSRSRMCTIIQITSFKVNPFVSQAIHRKFHCDLSTAIVLFCSHIHTHTQKLIYLQKFLSDEIIMPINYLKNKHMPASNDRSNYNSVQCLVILFTFSRTDVYDFPLQI